MKKYPVKVSQSSASVKLSEFTELQQLSRSDSQSRFPWSPDSEVFNKPTFWNTLMSLHMRFKFIRKSHRPLLAWQVYYSLSGVSCSILCTDIIFKTLPSAQWIIWKRRLKTKQNVPKYVFCLVLWWLAKNWGALPPPTDQNANRTIAVCSMVMNYLTLMQKAFSN